MLTEIDDTLDNIRKELEKTKMNLFGRASPVLNNNKERKKSPSTTQIDSEEVLLTALADKSKQMRNLTSLASEVQLLSNQGLKRRSPSPVNIT